MLPCFALADPTVYNPAPPPPAAAGGCVPPNVTGRFLSAFGKYYQLNSIGGGFGTERGYDAAQTDCSSAAKGGTLAIFKSQYQQWFVESWLLPDNLTGVVDSYWVGGVRNYARGTTMVTSGINTTWIWLDTLQYIGPLPRNESSGGPYARWAAGEPAFTTATGKPHRGCALAMRGLAWDTVGTWPVLPRYDGPLAVWGWKGEDCGYTRAYICELKCERVPVLLQRRRCCCSTAGHSRVLLPYLAAMACGEAVSPQRQHHRCMPVLSNPACI